MILLEQSYPLNASLRHPKTDTFKRYASGSQHQRMPAPDRPEDSERASVDATEENLDTIPDCPDDEEDCQSKRPSRKIIWSHTDDMSKNRQLALTENHSRPHVASSKLIASHAR